MRRLENHLPVVILWGGFATQSNTKSGVVENFKQYNADMQKAGLPYRHSQAD